MTFTEKLINNLVISFSGVQNPHGSRAPPENSVTDSDTGYLCNDSSDQPSGNAGMTERDNLTNNCKSGVY